MNFFNEIWIEPKKYKVQILTILVTFIVLLAYIMLNARKKKSNSRTRRKVMIKCRKSEFIAIYGR